MELREAVEFIKQTEQQVSQRLAGLELLGELSPTKADLDMLSTAILRLGPMAWPEAYPHTFALGVVSTAIFDYDGELWGHIDERFGPRNHSAMGQWFERYLRANHLPDFHYLVEQQHALRYLTPILAHALVPEYLIPVFMSQVVWPAVTQDDLRGSSAAELQERILREEPHMPRPVLRFVAHGGRTARDVIGRTVAMASASAQGMQVGSAALPAHFEHSVMKWLTGRTTGASDRLRLAARLRSPSLRYDDTIGRIVLELPHQDPSLGDLHWEVSSTAGFTEDRPASMPFWQRSLGSEEVELEAPSGVLHVTLSKDHARLRSWSIPAGSREQPVLFFSDRTLRARTASEFLEGTRWYVVRPRVSSMNTDGKMTVEADFGSPLGAWSEYIAELVRVDGGSELTVTFGAGSANYRLMDELPTAGLTVPDIPASLHSVDDSVVALENRLPRVRIPGRRGATPDANRFFIEQWKAVVSHDESGERYESTPLSLGAEFDGDAWEFGLEDLVPGADVGTWDLEVTGPLGLGFATRLALLPAMTFESPSTIEIAGSARPGRSVYVNAEAEFVVLERGDRAKHHELGWELQDSNRNGRIPFTVRDPRTSRETTAAFVLSTVNWQWIGASSASKHEERRIFDLREFIQQGDLSLRVTCPERVRLRLECLSGGGQTLHSADRVCEPHRGTLFRMRDFNSTLAEMGASAFFRLSIADAGADDQVLVGAVWHVVPLKGLQAGLTEAGLEFSWSGHGDPGPVRACLASDSRPWEPTARQPIECSGSTFITRFEEQSPRPGKYSFWLEEHDEWLGSAPISARRHLKAGTEMELRSHLRSQPLTAFRRLEELLSRSGAQPQSAVRAAFDGVTPDNVADLVELLTSVLSMGRAQATMNLDWSPLIPALTKFRGDVEPLLWAIGNSDPSLPIMSFCGTLGMPQWRSLSRADSAVAEHVTRRLWAKCPAVALICDSSRIRSSEPVRTACAGYLGADSIASFRSGDMRRMGGYIAAKDFQPTRGAVARLRGLLSSLSAPILSPEGWELACMHGLERLTDSADLQREALSVAQTCAPNVAQARGAIHGVLGWDVLQDRPSNTGQFPIAFLLTVSLAVAYSQRLLARQTHVRGELFPERKLESAVSLLSRALPEVYTHDLCVAELAVAGATR